MDPDGQVRENRLRRMAERRRYDFGTYSLIVPGACLPLAEARMLSGLRNFAKAGIDR